MRRDILYLRLSGIAFALLYILGCGTIRQTQTNQVPGTVVAIAPTESMTTRVPGGTPTDDASSDTNAGKDANPQPAILDVQGNQQLAGIGTYCWLEKCVDTVGAATVQEPLPVPVPLTATLLLPLDSAPAALQIRVFRATETDELKPTQGYRWWRVPENSDAASLLLAGQQQLALPAEPGLYVLDIFARWTAYGDVHYGFLVQRQ